jgi:cytidylate kinase
MEAPVITISRQFGSMGRSVAQRLASDLGISFMDRDIVKETARRMGLPISEVSRHDEKPGKSGFLMRRTYMFDFGVYSISKQIFEVQRSIISDFAESGPCIIVGRLAEEILRGRRNTLRVYICAPFDDRVANCAEKLQIGNEEECIAQIRKVDAARSAYRRHFAGHDLSPADFDLMVSTGRFGIDGCASIIGAIAKKHLKWS